MDGDVIRLVNDAFAYCFNEARFSNTSGSDTEHNENVGQVSTLMRALRSKDVDLFSRFDQIDESQAKIQNTSLKHLFIKNHDVAAKKLKIKDCFHLNIYLDSVEFLKK